MSDAGRRFRIYRTQVMDITLTEDDIEEQEAAGETSHDSAVMIAEHSPESSWSVTELEVVEL